MSKALSFQYAGQTGLYVVKDGYSLDTPNLPAEAFVFDSRWAGSVRVLSKTRQLISSLPTSTISGIGSVVRVHTSGGFTRIPFALVRLYSTNLRQNLPGLYTVSPIVLNGEVFVRSSDIDANTTHATTVLLDFPDNPTSPPAGASGTRRVRIAPEGLYVAVDPHEAVTASIDNHHIHPGMSPLMQSVGLLQGSSLPNTNGLMGGGALRWADYNVSFGNIEERVYLAQPDIYILFPNSTTVRVLRSLSIAHYIPVLR